MVPAGSEAWNLAMEQGEAGVRGNYDFCRLLGARAITQEFLEEGRYLGGDGVGGDAAAPMRAGV